jgi:hypothetical protein
MFDITTAQPTVSAAPPTTLMAPKSTLATVLGLALLATSFVLPAAPAIPPLIDPPTKVLVPGRFVWVDLFTTDPAASTEFYTKLFGWTAQPLETEGKAYKLLRNGARPVGGIVQGPASPDNKPAARWIGYISVPDVKRAVKAVKSAQGQLIAGPRLVPDRGMHAIVADSEGALVGLITSSAGDPEDYLAGNNDWLWATLFAREPGTAIPFYREVAGLEDYGDIRTENPDDYILCSGGYARAGVAKMRPDSKQEPAWVGFVRVTNVKEFTARTTALGGQVIVESATTTGANEIALLADPHGGVFGVVAYLEETEAN